MKFILLIVFAMGMILFTSLLRAGAKEKISYTFENSNDGWRIPDWAFYQNDHVATELKISSEEASHGDTSAEILCAFPGKTWAAALVEVERELDLTDYSTISADIYLPKKAPKNLIVARLILTVGDGWQFTEMKTPVVLERGKWTTVKARLESEQGESTDWKGRKEKRLFHHIDKIKKIAVRIEYDAAPPTRIGPKYEGPIYIDNVVIE